MIGNPYRRPPVDFIGGNIIIYLEKNFYRITCRGPASIIFIDDEYSERKRSRSDYHARIGEEKFKFNSTDQGAMIKLTYFTEVLPQILFIMLFAMVGMYIRCIMPFLISFALLIPVAYKMYYLNDYVIDDILEC